MAANRIFGLLPEAQAQQLIEIWKEFEAGETDNAKFAKSMDRLAPMMQNHSNNGGTWKEFNVPYQKVYNLKNYIQKGSITMWRYAENILNESLEKGYISKD